MIHFWIPHPPDRHFASWDPDGEPARYPSGIGHCLLELYKRLEARGLTLSIGPVTPSHADCVVSHLECFASWDGPAVSLDTSRLSAFVTQCRGARRVVVIRGDLPMDWVVPMPDAVQILPHRTAKGPTNSLWLPLLPQRGLIRRKEERRGRVETVGIFSFQENVPQIYRSPGWLAQLRSLGMTVVEKVYKDYREVAPDWHDFSDVDVLLCARHPIWSLGLDRKPPTKLVNAWSAGVIPIIGANEVASVDLGRPDVDCLVAASPEATVEVLARLHDPALVGQLEAGGVERASEFSVDRVVEQWLRLLTAEPPAPRASSAAARSDVVLTLARIGDRPGPAEVSAIERAAGSLLSLTGFDSDGPVTVQRLQEISRQVHSPFVVLADGKRDDLDQRSRVSSEYHNPLPLASSKLRVNAVVAGDGSW